MVYKFNAWFNDCAKEVYNEIQQDKYRIHRAMYECEVEGWYELEVSFYKVKSCSDDLFSDVSINLVYNHPEYGFYIACSGNGTCEEKAIEDFIKNGNKLDGDGWNAFHKVLAEFVSKSRY